jgi:uncharacterized membrane protein
MKRDTRIVLAVIAPIPAVILAASVLCSWAIAAGASVRWRGLFRLLCHGIVERSFFLFDVPMPICARCTGIYIGLLAGMLAFLAVPWLRERVVRAIAIAAATPLAIDGLTQLAQLRTSTNPLRLSTGLVAGFFFGLWILSAVERGRDTAFTPP